MDMHLNPCKPGKRPMIQRVTDRLATQSRGLRFIAGDFNQDDGQMNA